MTIPLDDITRKKLILVRQLFQRAVLQAEARHSYVDRIMALIGFDLTNETLLKAVVSAINSSVIPKSDFQAIVQQADNELTSASLPSVPDKARIQHVRTIRNDAQHKAKYPNETDVSDCRTYTKDFLSQIILNVWGEKFESISIIDLIQNGEIKNYLKDAESKLQNSDFSGSLAALKAAFETTFNSIKKSIVGHIPYNVESIVVGKGFKEQTESKEVFNSFILTRNLQLYSLIGLNFQDYIKYQNITNHIYISFFGGGKYRTTIVSAIEYSSRDTEYVLKFVSNAVIQIESLVGDIHKPFQSS